MNLNLKALAISWLATVVVVGIGMLGIGVLLGKKRVADYKRGWNLTKVVVAARDLPAGTTLSNADLTVREVPEQLIASALRETELQLAVGHPLTVPLKQNDLLARWMYTPGRVGESCQRFAEDLARAANVDGAPEVKQLLAELSQQTDGGVHGQ